MKRYTEDVQGEKITYWRSIENRTRTLSYLKSIEDEFYEDITDITSMDRRSMLKVMGASVALSGIGISCRRPVENIFPFVNQPESITPGIPNYFATARPTPFGASGLLVESHESRPTKIEGNPLHPENNGKASIFDQASVLEVYDPDRSRFIKRMKAGSRLPQEWSDYDVLIGQKILEFSENQGEGLAFLTDLDLSPTLLRLKSEVKKRFPKVRFYTHEPLRNINIEDAIKLAFGENLRVKYFFDKAKIICTLFSDPMAFGPEHVKHMSGYAKNRQIYHTDDVSKMSRLYSVEADYSLSGTNSDHRMSLPIGLAKRFLEALAYELHANFNIDIKANIKGGRTLAKVVSAPPSYKGIDRKFLSSLAKDLALNQGQSLIVGGDHLPKELLAFIHVINVSLNNLNKTFEIIYLDDELSKKHLAEANINILNQDLLKGSINTLFIMGVNPLYTAPRHLNFKESLEKVPLSIHVGLHDDETAQACTWHLPQSHFLESFLDTRSYDGTISIIQPLISPLFSTRSNLQIFSQWTFEPSKEPLEAIKATYKRFDKDFRKVVHDGFIENSSFPKLNNIFLDCEAIFQGFLKTENKEPNQNNFELILSFDRKVLDGRYANNSWLQELPDPVTKMNWDNALFISPKAAKLLNLTSGVDKNAYVSQIVNIVSNGKNVSLPTFVVPGLSEFSLVANLGYGRTNAGEVGNGVGVDVYDLLVDFSSMVMHGVKVSLEDRTVRLSTTQEQFAMNADVVQDQDILSLQNRDPARVGSTDTFLKNPQYAKEKEGLPLNLLEKEPGKEKLQPLQITKPWDYSKNNQWGMVIDLSKCTGCNACVVACQSENNIPVVGKEQVIRGRIMHWLRVDRYFTGDVHNPKSVAQPIPCQHCENAPCEPVCPVAATSHDKEGLNAMTYNRCIGTRYCANNCPFKVRRFNYFDFSHSGNLYVNPEIEEREKTLKMQRNPDVTVRYRGVMEKCTYCTQRIQEAKIKARRDNQDQDNLPDGAVTPACAQTCPAEAITFGNIIDEESRVFKLKNLNRNYTLLDVLNVRPRTSYLSKLRNPHPDLV